MPIDAINSINSSVAVTGTARILAQAGLALQKSQMRISSGLRITSPEIDAAGLAQFMKLEAQLDRMSAADVNEANAISFSQTQDGYLQGVQNALNRMGELSLQAQDVTKNPEDLASLQKEFSQLQDFVGDVGKQKFNGVDLFSGNDLPVSSDSEGGTVTLKGLDAGASGSSGGLADVASGVTVSSPSAAASALSTINNAMRNMADFRATVGANLQAVNATREGNSTLMENLSAAGRRLNGADIAAESTQLASAKTQMLVATKLG